MSRLNWGMIPDGGVFESLMHAVLFAENPSTILFGRPGPDQGQDARSADGTVVYQAKFRQGLNMDGAIALAHAESAKIKTYRQPTHANYVHWQHTQRWILVANLSINPNDVAKWHDKVAPEFQREGLSAELWSIETLEGKLAQHSEIRDVFFANENRVLIGLKEAHTRLSDECVASGSLRLPLVGRERELAEISSFARSSDKRVLPVVGRGGIGKSRLLYEGLLRLAGNGWRVLWALTASMARSTQWHRLLNGTQPTCVVVDDPDEAGLLRVVVEQLAVTERRNWKAIVACRTERSELLRGFRKHAIFQSQLDLGPLDEPSSKSLLNACLGGQAEPPWAHRVYTLTQGIPAWICLIGELARKRALPDLPATADEVAATYVQSCIVSLPEDLRKQAAIILRWLSLWEILKLGAASTEQAELDFLGRQGIAATTSRDLLSRLAETGLVRNWGVEKRLYAVQPAIVRQQILGRWLLRESAGQYSVSDEGAKLVEKLVAGEVPALDSALKSLSIFARSRLSESEAICLMKPFFKAMADKARHGSLLNQYAVADLIEKAGIADPESALDVLTSIRSFPKDDVTVGNPIWGPQTLTHRSLVSSLPWVLYQVAEHVADSTAAKRFIVEFRHLIALQDARQLDIGSGKEPRQLFKRLLRESSNAETYTAPAYEMTIAGLITPTAWPFVGLLAECLLDPIRESAELVSNWTISIERKTLVPDSAAWNQLMELRRMTRDALRTCKDATVRGGLWNVLNKSHHDIHRAVRHEKLKADVALRYDEVLVDDLRSTLSLLQSPPFPMDLEEATHARQIWSRYLAYGREQDPVDLAKQCEEAYNSISPWPFHEFFRFDTQEHLASETARVLTLLRGAASPAILSKFFNDAERHLLALRHGSQDVADDWRIVAIADECANLFMTHPSGTENVITAFVGEVLGRVPPINRLAWRFAARVCLKHLHQIKLTENHDAVARRVDDILKLAKAEDRLLYELYSNVHPSSTGPLLRAELDAILAHETQFSPHEWFVLLSAFVVVDPEQVYDRLRTRLNSLRNNRNEASQCMECFVRSSHLAALCYDWKKLPVPWIVEMVKLYQLDGKILGMHELECMRVAAGFRMSMRQFVDFMRHRLLLDVQSDPYANFCTMPDDFDVTAWCSFNPQDETEMAAFMSLCGFAVGGGFTALYWVPKYLARIDPTGAHVADYVNTYLLKNRTLERPELSRLAHLASAYSDSSDAWSKVAGPICTHAQTFGREDRERIYFGLSRRETVVIPSAIGQVAAYYVQARDAAARMRDSEPPDSPLRGYREWAYRRADADLLREQQSVEEDFNV